MFKEIIKPAAIKSNYATNKEIEELLSCANPTNYQDALTEMWEAWITHENTNEKNHTDRAYMLFVYKQISGFFESLK